MIFPMSNKIFFTVFLVSCFWLSGCTKAQILEKPDQTAKTEKEKPQKIEKIKNPGKVINVLVALCDNDNQGIVPVPAHLGDGADADTNLYWGAAYGVKTFFSKSANWEKIASFENPKINVLQRLIFKHKRENVYLVADAYDGSRMKQTIADFFGAVSGNKLENIEADNKTLQIFGSANLIAFVGHNGLMDFDLENPPTKNDDEQRDAVILACASRQYFSAPLKKTGANPVLWTTNLMAPEAYILHDALEGWIAGETNEQIQTRAAEAYAKYQKISVRSAQNLLVTGW
jgi:hypothetical protein